jgi:hypothetical protein
MTNIQQIVVAQQAANDVAKGEYNPPDKRSGLGELIRAATLSGYSEERYVYDEAYDEAKKRS